MKKLYHSRTDRKIWGVCGGLGKYFGIDPTIIRVIAIVSIFFTGLGVIAYIAMAIIVPLENPEVTVARDEGKDNVMMVITPYWHQGTWVFDDESVGLSKEPFVAGVPEMIDDLVKDIPNARSGFRLIFSSVPFPGYEVELERVREEYGGYWYRIKEQSVEGWLCPALFKYFETAPERIYTKAEQLLPHAGFNNR